MISGRLGYSGRLSIRCEKPLTYTCIRCIPYMVAETVKGQYCYGFGAGSFVGVSTLVMPTVLCRLRVRLSVSSLVLSGFHSTVCPTHRASREPLAKLGTQSCGRVRSRFSTGAALAESRGRTSTRCIGTRHAIDRLC